MKQQQNTSSSSSTKTKIELFCFMCVFAWSQLQAKPFSTRLHTFSFCFEVFFVCCAVGTLSVCCSREIASENIPRTTEGNFFLLYRFEDWIYIVERGISANKKKNNLLVKVFVFSLRSFRSIVWSFWYIFVWGFPLVANWKNHSSVSILRLTMAC